MILCPLSTLGKGCLFVIFICHKDTSHGQKNRPEVDFNIILTFMVHVGRRLSAIKELFLLPGREGLRTDGAAGVLEDDAGGVGDVHGVGEEKLLLIGGEGAEE